MTYMENSIVPDPEGPSWDVHSEGAGTIHREPAEQHFGIVSRGIGVKGMPATLVPYVDLTAFTVLGSWI